MSKMSELSPPNPLLNALSPEIAADILLDALPHTTARELPHVCRELWGTGQNRAYEAIVSKIHLLGTSFIPGNLTDQEKAGLLLAANSMILHDDHQKIFNALEVAAGQSDIRFLKHFPALLLSKDESVADRAATVLLQVVCVHFEGGGSGSLSLDHLDLLDEILAESMESYRNHRRDEVLLTAAMFAAHAGMRLTAILKQPDHPATLAMRQIGERTDETMVRRHLIPWLTIEPLGRSIVRWLHRLESPDEYADFLSRGHLLSTPSRRRLLRRVHREEKCLLPIESLMALPESTQRFLPSLPGAYGLSDMHRVQRWGEMVALSSPIARLRAVTELGASRRKEAGQALNRFLHDRHPPVRRLAARHLLRSRRALPRIMTKSPDPFLVRCGMRCTAHHGHHEFWRSLLELAPSIRAAKAWRWLQVDRDLFLEHLDRTLRSSDPSMLRGAIELTRRLRLVPEMETRLLELTMDADGHAASAAVASLEHGTQSERLGVVRQAFGHPDRRVGANAVETLAKINRRGNDEGIASLLRPWFHGLASHRQSRIRGNAVLALIRMGDPMGLDCLPSLLIDARPRHRLAGVWVTRVGRVHIIENTLDRLALEDSRSEIRIRAEATRRMLAGDARNQKINSEVARV